MKKYTMYVGLNDKSTKTQKVKTAAVDMIIEYIKDATLTKCTGFYTHKDGSVTVEKTIKIEKLDFNGDMDIKKAASDLKRMFNQGSIGVEITEVEAMLL